MHHDSRRPLLEVWEKGCGSNVAENDEASSQVFCTTFPTVEAEFTDLSK
jgi:hypothetical protein